MVPGWAVLALSLGYVGLLFAIAYYGDRRARARGRSQGKPLVYALSLAVYCTSWTFYGSVGLASRTGYDFLPIYLGPILMFVIGLPLLRRIVRISKSHNITSIADLIAARYGKSQLLAAIVTVIAVIGVLPYIALQLQAVSTSFTVLMRYPLSTTPADVGGHAIWSDTALIVSLVLALFAILFGTRNINATEHNEGMMLAIAFESLVKLVAFISVGAFVTWGMFDGWSDILARVRAAPALSSLFSGGVDGATWVTMTGLALAAIICLPRQFHVAVVENVHERDLRKAAWLFPLYLVAINIFVVPVAAAGLLVIGASAEHGDMFVLALPMAGGQSALALFAFIGGLSAATAMVIVESVAISNMVSNDLVMPIVLHRRRLGLSDREDMGSVILQVRRVAIVSFMLLAYCTYRLLGDGYALASIGLLSFAAVAQFAPALLGGLIWRGATQKGAIAGILAGFSVWAYTLFLPTLMQSGAFSGELLASGPFGISLLRPQQLFGLRFDPLTHGVFWSLLANVTAYALCSLLSVPKVIERLQASAFVDADAGAGQPGLRQWHGSVRVSELAMVAASYLGPERAQRSFEDFAALRGTPLAHDAEADFALVRHTERLLASAIGASSARLVMALTLERQNLGADDAMRLLDDATAAIQYNRDLLQSTLENVRQGISVFDRELHLVCWNRRFRDLLELPAALGSVGVTLPEIMRFNAERGEYGPGNPDDLVARQLELFLGDGESVLEYRRPNGTVLEVRRSPMPGGGYVTTYSDITEHVRVAAQLAAANEYLEERVRERTAELTTLNAELDRARITAEEADLGKTRFVAAASHDLLQPLNAARLYVSSSCRAACARGQQPEPAGRRARAQDRRLARLGRGAARHAARHLEARCGRHDARVGRLCSRRAVRGAQARVRPPCGEKEARPAHRAHLPRREERPAASSSRAAESALQCRSLYRARQGAHGCPPDQRLACDPGVGYRLRHPGGQAPPRLQGIPTLRQRPGHRARARPRPLDRGAHQPHPRPSGELSLRGGPRHRLHARRAARHGTRAGSLPGLRAGAADADERAARRTLHRQRAERARRTHLAARGVVVPPALRHRAGCCAGA